MHRIFKYISCSLEHIICYFICYVLNNGYDCRQNLIHPPFVKRVYSECSPLIQLIALINNHKADKNNTILVMIESKSYSFCRFAFSVSRLYLNSYNPECKILDCFVCKSE